MFDFQGATLLISARSPFARRVRLAFLESEIDFSEKVFNVFEAVPELTKVNPASRVPTLVLRNQEVLIDSNYILKAFYESYPQNALIPKNSDDKITDYKWSAMATAMYDKIIEYYLENLRPKDLQDLSVFEDCRVVISRICHEFENHIKGKTTILSNQLSQSDLDMATGLEYLLLRNPDGWSERFPSTFLYLNTIKHRGSFQRTTPPPV